MDFSFHIQQGQKLLEKKEASSMKRALEHFVEANKMTENEDIGKPKTLYFLSLGNYLIGNIEMSYMIAYKAKRSIDKAIENSMISMDNMRQMLGEDDIDALINHIEENLSQHILYTTNENDDFDENELDFSNVNKLYESSKYKEVKANYSLNDLTNDVILATFAGMGRTNDELVYFDKAKGNVLMHVSGYFTPMTGDQSISGQILANRITNGEPTDFVDETKHILIDRLMLIDFLGEYKVETKGEEPFYSFAEEFSNDVLKDFSYNNDITIKDLTFSNHIQEKFHKLFGEKYQSRVYELKDKYTTIFEKTCQTLARNWIENKVLI